MTTVRPTTTSGRFRTGIQLGPRPFSLLLPSTACRRTSRAESPVRAVPAMRPTTDVSVALPKDTLVTIKKSEISLTHSEGTEVIHRTQKVKPSLSLKNFKVIAVRCTEIKYRMIQSFISNEKF